MIFIGIDPGKGGGVALLDSSPVHEAAPAQVLPFTDEATVRDWLSERIPYSDAVHCFALIEKSQSMPKQGVSSVFTYGCNYGFWRGLLICMRIPFDEVRPQRWQKAMGCMTKGDKNVSKAKAAQLFPYIRMTHAIADALLIADYNRRTYIP